MSIFGKQEPVKRAFQRHIRSLGEPDDPEFRKYASLDLDQFNSIVEKYGLDNALRYMKTMEARRMGVNK